MNSTLEPTKTRMVALDENFLKLLERQVAVRYLVFHDSLSESESLSAVIFGTTITRKYFFWMKVSVNIDDRVGCSSRIDFEVWDSDISTNFLAKLNEWEEKKVAAPWWGKLVSTRPFEGVMVFDAKHMREVPAANLNLALFHGILVARVEEHARVLAEMVTKDMSLRERADAFKRLTERFSTFVGSIRREQRAQTIGN